MYQCIVIILSFLHFLFPPASSMIQVFRYGRLLPSGFSMEFHILYTIAHLARYSYYVTMPKEVLAKIPEELLTTYSIQRWVESNMYINCEIALFAAVFIVEGYYEKKPNINWIVGGIVVSYVLAADFTNSSEVSTTSMWYTFGLYLEVISFLPQFGLTLQKMYMEERVLEYYVGMFIYDVLSMAGLTYCAFGSNFYTTVGFKIHVLKFLLCCGVFSSYVFEKFNRSQLWFQRPGQDNDYPIGIVHVMAKPIASYSAEKSDDLIRIILEGGDIPMSEPELMLPN